MKKWFKNLLTETKISINNTKARINRKLATAGFGGGIINGFTELEIKHIRNGKVIKTRRILDRVITDAFVADIVDVLQGIAGPLAAVNAYKYHGSGTGIVAEAAADVALGTEVGTRVIGTQIEGATANIYKSVATITYAGAYAITEHGLFSASAGAVLMDRTKFAAVNTISGDNIQYSFTIQLTSGG